MKVIILFCILLVLTTQHFSYYNQYATNNAYGMFQRPGRFTGQRYSSGGYTSGGSTSTASTSTSTSTTSTSTTSQQYYRYNHQHFSKCSNPLWNAFQEGVEDDQVYQKLGLSNGEIYELKAKQKDAHVALDLYFKAHQICPHVLQRKLKAYASVLDQIEDKYLSKFNNVIIGQNNDVKGENNFVKANQQTVNGSDNFVIDGKYSQIPLKGNNKLRLGRYQISLNKLNSISSNPFQAIKILSCL